MALFTVRFSIRWEVTDAVTEFTVHIDGVQFVLIINKCVRPMPPPCTQHSSRVSNFKAKQNSFDNFVRRLQPAELGEFISLIVCSRRICISVLFTYTWKCRAAARNKDMFILLCIIKLTTAWTSYRILPITVSCRSRHRQRRRRLIKNKYIFIFSLFWEAHKILIVLHRILILSRTHLIKNK